MRSGASANVCKLYLLLVYIFIFHFRFRFFSPKRRIHVHLVDLVKSFPTSIEHYLLAKFGVDTAENEPLIVWR